LPIGHVMTLRGEIFNHPRNCTHGVAPLQCGDQDLADPAVGGSVIFLESSYLRATDAATFFGHLLANDTRRALFGDGLTDPRRAAVHLVVMDHGPALPDVFHDQVTTLGAGCNEPAPGAGTPGPNTCTDLQYSAHE
jgi:hypothetical protein